MIKIELTKVVGWEHAIRGMRNPKNSWHRSDSRQCIDSCDDCDNFSVCNINDELYFKNFWEGGSVYDTDYAIGPNDHKLMMQLAKGGPVHAKYRRMIAVYVDITAPLYWWKEFDTYKVGTVSNSCSTMHKIHDKVFELDDFSYEHLMSDSRYDKDNDAPLLQDPNDYHNAFDPVNIFVLTVHMLNACRAKYLEVDTKLHRTDLDLSRETIVELCELKKQYWWQMIQLLPSSYNQRRTIMLNYEVLTDIYSSRKNHKLDEWREFCEWIESLPYSEIITGKEKVEESENKENV